MVFSDFVLADYAMSNDSLPMPTAVWSDGGTSLDTNIFMAPEGGDVFNQEITLVYELFDEQAICVGSADATQVVHIPSSIDLVVTGGINDNLVCEGEALTLSWRTLPNDLWDSIGRLMSRQVLPPRSRCRGVV